MANILLITGGTGSFGEAVLEKISNQKIKKYSEIRVFSRDEKKQFDMRKKFSNQNIKFYLGDVRDQTSLNNALKGVNHVFHAAALKQVPSCEFYPEEAINTNIMGARNLIQASVKNNVKKVVFLSTDKAVYPINSMGLTKALMEKLVVANHLIKNDQTILCVTRYGNVMGSRGSVIPTFSEQIKKNIPLTITNKNMTRFMMTMDEAIDLVLYALNKGKNGEILVKKTDSASIEKLINVLKKYYNKPKVKIKNIGIRHGEKMHETLLTAEEMSVAIEKKNFFIIPANNRDINYDKFFKQGNKKNISIDYNSKNAKQLSDKELLSKIKKVFSK
ncbi:polysaccharide biosynthesis protein [Pelagibacterales bacterium SAG-MED14]|nr:polysaccharide biosynthesis protein [Pelagibacterales bacterium SAG-MED14]